VAKLIPDASRAKNFFMPFHKEDGLFWWPWRIPRDPLLLEEIRMKTGDEVRPFLAMPTDIEKELDKVYGTQMADDEAPMSEAQLDDAAEEKTREIMESFRDSDQVEPSRKRRTCLRWTRPRPRWNGSSTR
jgi:hypothetical protein